MVRFVLSFLLIAAFVGPVSAVKVNPRNNTGNVGTLVDGWYHYNGYYTWGSPAEVKTWPTISQTGVFPTQVVETSTYLGTISEDGAAYSWARSTINGPPKSLLTNSAIWSAKVESFNSATVVGNPSTPHCIFSKTANTCYVEGEAKIVKDNGVPITDPTIVVARYNLTASNTEGHDPRFDLKAWYETSTVFAQWVAPTAEHVDGGWYIWGAVTNAQNQLVVIGEYQWGALNYTVDSVEIVGQPTTKPVATIHKVDDLHGQGWHNGFVFYACSPGVSGSSTSDSLQFVGEAKVTLITQ